MEDRQAPDLKEKPATAINRRSFFGVLLGIRTAAMGALLAIPVLSSATMAAQSAAPVAADTADGRAIFVANGCAACHGQKAEGTHFAPSLIGVGRLFPGPQLPNLLRNPSKKMRDGGMPSVKVDDAHLKLLVAYLSGLGASPAGSPSAPSQAGPSSANPAGGAQVAATSTAVTQAAPAPLSAEALRGKALFHQKSCESCHGIGGVLGTIAAPGLAGTASVLPEATLENLLRHHSKQMQQGGMPLTNMRPQDMSAIIAYILSLSLPADAQ